MAKLFEYQAKELLSRMGLPVPRGRVASSPAEARSVAAELGGPVVVKAQAWVTGRAQAGGILFAADPPAAEAAAGRVLGLRLKGFTVTQVLVEERLAVKREFYLGLVMDDVTQGPALIFSDQGGAGVEEIAARRPERVARLPLDVGRGLPPHQARDLLVGLDIRGDLQNRLTDLLVKFYGYCARFEVRSAEINPLVLTEGGEVLAADCHTVVDDYAVARHPELGIELAREFDRPPTPLEKIAYRVETRDHRGTFYFFQMDQDPAWRPGYVGFHGGGGSGSMMSMDALLGQGFKVANFCDTSGNPSAAKVYRAARIILAQPNLIGCFASGSGVASQEQFHSARGLVKAFREVNPAFPAVIRLGGNSEELAMAILHRHTRDLAVKVEAFGRAAPASACARRLKELVSDWGYGQPRPPAPPAGRARRSTASRSTTRSRRRPTATVPWTPASSSSRPGWPRPPPWRPWTPGSSSWSSSRTGSPSGTSWPSSGPAGRRGPGSSGPTPWA
jgi:succinyl-CoA synthetase beta subunit